MTNRSIIVIFSLMFVTSVMSIPLNMPTEDDMITEDAGFTEDLVPPTANNFRPSATPSALKTRGTAIRDPQDKIHSVPIELGSMQKLVDESDEEETLAPVSATNVNSNTRTTSLKPTSNNKGDLGNVVYTVRTPPPKKKPLVEEDDDDFEEEDFDNGENEFLAPVSGTNSPVKVTSFAPIKPMMHYSHVNCYRNCGKKSPAICSEVLDNEFSSLSAFSKKTCDSWCTRNKICK